VSACQLESIFYCHNSFSCNRFLVLLLFLIFPFYFPNATGDETLRGLSIQAAQRALEMAEVKAEDVDLVLLCTSTPDDLFGGAAQVSNKIYLSVIMPFFINILAFES